MQPTQFASYQSPSPPRYDGFVRESRYLTMRDGVRLALDTYRPTHAGTHAAEPLPVLLALTPYNRASVIDGKLVHSLMRPVVNGRERLNPSLELSQHGYVIAWLDVRGQGASFGSLNGVYSVEEGQDAAEVIDWLCAQPWCSGKVGMFGSSYAGGTQFLAAAEAPSGLAALFVCHSFFDVYDTVFPGGVPDLLVAREFSALLDTCAGRVAPTQAAPVDGPEGAALLAEAVEEHRRGMSAVEACAAMQVSGLRDGTGYFDHASPSGSQNLCTLLPRLRKHPLPCYHYGGFNDFFVDQTVLWFDNWRQFAPAKLTLGPWTHLPNHHTSPRDDEDLRVRCNEALRWFDHWLKGIPNGVLDEAPVHVAVQSGHHWRSGDFESVDDGWAWQASSGWPLDGMQPQRWHFTAGPSGSVASLNDGGLQLPAPLAPARHRLRVKPGVGVGPQGRMAASFQLAPLRLPEMSNIDAQCLTFSTDVLTQDLIVAGTPVLHFHATSDAPDAAFVVWLEDVDEVGRSTLISYGSLRASHRALGSAPYDTAGVPWHASTAEVVVSTPHLNAGVATIELALLPVANSFVRGHRVRVTIAGGDHGNLEPVCPGGELTLFSGPEHPSFITLPVHGDR